MDPVAEAAAALRLADRAPAEAGAAARRAVALARRAGDRAALSVAERALGRSLLQTGRVPDAIRHLRLAVDAADRADLAGEARVPLAAALVQRGESAAALREIDAAVSELAGAGHARARAQRADVLHQIGHLDAALAEYQAAIPLLRRAGDALNEQRTLVNRGILHTERHAFAAAEADLRAADALARGLGRHLAVGIIAENLGFLDTLRGDVPSALRHLARAEATIGAHGGQLGPVYQDRAELLLSTGVVAEARADATRAIAAFTAEGRRSLIPPARLLLAHTAFLAGDWAAAVEEAERARREFARQRRPEWAAAARLTALRARAAAGESGYRVPSGLVAALAGWPAAAVEARLAAARVSSGRTATAHLTAAATARRRGPAALRARGWYAEALRRLAANDPRGALTATRSGLSILDEHAAALSATDLRAHSAAYRTDLTDLGLRIALTEGTPHAVFEWAERGRASRLAHHALTPPPDPDLAALLTHLRTTARTGRPTDQAHLERQIRDAYRARETSLSATALSTNTTRGHPNTTQTRTNTPTPPNLPTAARSNRQTPTTTPHRPNNAPTPEPTASTDPPGQLNQPRSTAHSTEQPHRTKDAYQARETAVPDTPELTELPRTTTPSPNTTTQTQTTDLSNATTSETTTTSTNPPRQPNQPRSTYSNNTTEQPPHQTKDAYPTRETGTPNIPEQTELPRTALSPTKQTQTTDFSNATRSETTDTSTEPPQQLNQPRSTAHSTQQPHRTKVAYQARETREPDAPEQTELPRTTTPSPNTTTQTQTTDADNATTSETIDTSTHLPQQPNQPRSTTHSTKQPHQTKDAYPARETSEPNAPEQTELPRTATRSPNATKRTTGASNATTSEWTNTAAASDPPEHLHRTKDAYGPRESEPADPLSKDQACPERPLRSNKRSAGRPATPAALGEALGDRALVEYVRVGDGLIALTLIDGALTMHDLGDARLAADLVDRLAFALHRLARPHRDPRASSVLLADAAARLDGLLLAGVPDRPLVVVPTGALHGVPWSLLPSCAGRPVSVAPSATLWLGAPAHRPPETVAVAAGPGLSRADAEARAVAAIYGHIPLLGPEATAQAVTEAMSGADLLHLAAHGRVAADNPLFSSLRLFDGPLLVYDLEHVPAVPRTVVLAACDTGRPVVCAGDELLGLAAAFIGRGTAALIAPVVAIPDAETAPLMVALHRHLADGHPPAEALAAAQAQLLPDGGPATAAAAAFVCLGAG